MILDGKRPNFFIVGAPRAGTTLFAYLNSTKGVYMSKVKEPSFFHNTLPESAIKILFVF